MLAARSCCRSARLAPLLALAPRPAAQSLLRRALCSSAPLLYRRSAPAIFPARRTLLVPQPPHRGMSPRDTALLPRFHSSRRDSETDADKDDGGAPAPRSLKQLVKEYGRIAVAVYFSCSFLTFVGCYLTVLHFDLSLDTIKGFKERIFGGASSIPPTESTSAPPGNQQTPDDSGNSQFFAQLLVAMAFTKLFVPLKLALAAFFTPVVARRLRAMGWDVGGKSMRALGKELKAEIKEKMGKN